jgi:hypothetical protein
MARLRLIVSNERIPVSTSIGTMVDPVKHSSRLTDVYPSEGHQLGMLVEQGDVVTYQNELWRVHLVLDEYTLVLDQRGLKRIRVGTGDVTPMKEGWRRKLELIG